MSNHTPGPYIIGQPGGPSGPFYSLVNPQGRVVAMQIPNKADAHLLQAAPDLYAACMRVIDCEGDGTIFEPDSPFAAIVDAVRKAQGGMQ